MGYTKNFFFRSVEAALAERSTETASRLNPELSRKPYLRGLKPSSAEPFTARLKPCPSFDSLFPRLLGSAKGSCAVQIGH
jgi:hypothetical protein